RRRPSPWGGARARPPCAAGARSRRRSNSCARGPCGCARRGTGTSRARSRRARPARRAPRRPAPPPSGAATSPRPPAGRSGPAPPPAPSSLRALRLLLDAEHLGDVVEHAVHEGGRVLAPEAARDLDRFVDGDRGGDVGPRQELAGGEAEQAQVHAREAWQPPVLGAGRDERVDALAVRGDAVDQLAGKDLHVQLSWGPVRCSRAARAALLRCPQTPSAGSSALALSLLLSGGLVEVRPEERHGRIALARQVELVERLEGQLARCAPRAHQALCTTRRRCTISSAVTAAS